MVFEEIHPRTARTARNRRGPRMNSRVPVAVQWRNDKGAQQFEAGHTRVISLYGCLLVSPRELHVGQRLQMTNLTTSRVTPAAVVWKGIQRPDGWDLGVEFSEGDFDFWGLDF
jgi:hypothetical protein